MEVDFYQLGETSAEAALVPIAERAQERALRLLVVSHDAPQLERISAALWARPGSFLAHGRLGQGHEPRQPILLAERIEPANGAAVVALADGRWRDEALGFERALLLFGEATVAEARATWRALDGREGCTRRYWRQEGRRWIQAA